VVETPADIREMVRAERVAVAHFRVRTVRIEEHVARRDVLDIRLGGQLLRALIVATPVRFGAPARLALPALARALFAFLRPVLLWRRLRRLPALFLGAEEPSPSSPRLTARTFFAHGCFLCALRPVRQVMRVLSRYGQLRDRLA